jgi:mannose-6-phosphate isomerase-like protein (cupin superfamily)
VITRSSFAEEGFAGPVSVFTPALCRFVMQHLRLGDRPPPLNWPKGIAASDRVFYDLATDPALVALVRSLLGDDLVLWGTTIVERNPGAVHHWHTDIESSAADGRFVSVWIGLENTARASALKLVSRSHTFGAPIQRVAQQNGLRRGQVVDERVAAWARTRHPSAGIVQPDASDGDAILFDGRMWHSSHNTLAEGRRTALLLQYAAAGTPLFIPDFNQLEWPFRFTAERPPTVVVSGKQDSRSNELVPRPPVPRAGTRLVTVAKSLTLPLERDEAKGWRPHKLFRGRTPVFELMACHASVLDPGHSPHAPHSHIEEELLIVLDGEAEVVIADGPSENEARIETLRRGEFVYHPAFQHHTIRNAAAAPVTYLMFKWRAAPANNASPLASTIFRGDIFANARERKPFASRRLFEHPTAFLQKLHAHVTVLEPGAGYAPHTDDYDVAIVTFDGAVKTVGRTVRPHGVIYYAAGEPHGMRNVGNAPARYLVFEFHPPKDRPRGELDEATSPPPVISRLRSFLDRWRLRLAASSAGR